MSRVGKKPVPVPSGVTATVDGQTTAHYVTELVAHLPIRVTRLAHGVPIGGELDYLDEGTLAQALRAEAGTSVVADASNLQAFDSSALAVLLDCRREALAAGKTFSVHQLPPRLRELAALYGVAELLPAAS